MTEPLCLLLVVPVVVVVVVVAALSLLSCVAGRPVATNTTEQSKTED